MAVGEKERLARAEGDVVYSTFTPLTGALVGGSIALATSAPGISTRVQVFAERSLRGDLLPSALLGDASSLMGRTTGVVAIAAVAGALLFGMAQTRGYFGRPGRAPEGVSSEPGVGLALAGWFALMGLAVMLSLELVRLHPAAPSALGVAGMTLVHRSGRALLITIGVLAALDHLWKRRARRNRLGLDETDRTARAYPPPVELDDAPRWDEVVALAAFVVFDTERAIAIAVDEGGGLIVARAQGLHATALREAARKHGKAPVAVADLQPLAALPRGAKLDAAQLERWGLVVPDTKTGTA